MDWKRSPHRSKAGSPVVSRILAATLVLLITQPTVTLAGMVLKEKTELVGGAAEAQGAGSSQLRESTTYLQGKKIRTETASRVWVLDFDKGVLLTINPSAKTYTQMTLQDLRVAQEQAVEWMGTLRAQVEERMKTLPPEQQEAMKKKLASFPKGTFGEEKPAKITLSEIPWL